jgi:hypothetical protein
MLKMCVNESRFGVMKFWPVLKAWQTGLTFNTQTGGLWATLKADQKVHSKPFFIIAWHTKKGGLPPM